MIRPRYVFGGLALAGAICASAVFAAGESAGESGSSARMTPPSPEVFMASEMREGEGLSGPSAYYELCRRAPADCPAPQKLQKADRVIMDDAAAEAIVTMNQSINQAIRPVSDYERYGLGDFWEFPRDGVGDCEEYVIAKRAALLDMGFPESALLIGVALGVGSPYHAVLLVRTDSGEIVLDNLTDRVSPWRDSGLTFVVRQSALDSRRWVRVLPSEAAPKALPKTEEGPVTNVSSTRVIRIPESFR